MMEKKQFEDLANVVENLESEKKDIAEDIKDKISMAAQEGNADKKALTKAVKEFLKYRKDSQAYLATDLEVSNILVTAIPEYGDS